MIKAFFKIMKFNPDKPSLKKARKASQFSKVITDKYNNMEHNNSPRSIMKNQSFDMLD